MRSLSQLKTHLKKNPLDARAWYDLSVAQANERNLNETHEALRKALGCNPAEEDLLIMIGMSLEAMNDAEAAIEAFGRACRTNPGSVACFRHFGAGLLKAGQPAQAIEPLRRAAKLSNYASDDCLHLATALERVDNIEEAMSYYHLAADSGRDSVEANRQLGRMLARVGHFAGAIRAWRHVMHLAPGDMTAMTALGISLSSWGKHEEAIQLLTEVVRERPDSAEAYADLGIAMTRGGLHEPAIRALQRAISLRPTSAQAHLNLGVALMGAQRAEEAMAAFWEVIALAPDWSVAHYNLGMALKELGDLEGARDALNRAAGIDPNDPEIQSALRGVLLGLSGLGSADPSHSGGSSSGGRDPSRTGSITGELNVFGLPDLLEFLKVRGASGVLKVISPRGTGELLMEKGDLIGAQAPGIRTLTDQLLALKAITRDDLEVVLEDERARQDPIVAAVMLAEDGIITASRLREAVWQQIRTTIVEMVGWREGDFRYLERPPNEQVHPVLASAAIDTRHALLEVMAEIDHRGPRP